MGGTGAGRIAGSLPPSRIAIVGSVQPARRRSNTQQCGGAGFAPCPVRAAHPFASRRITSLSPGCDPAGCIHRSVTAADHRSLAANSPFKPAKTIVVRADGRLCLGPFLFVEPVVGNKSLSQKATLGGGQHRASIGQERFTRSSQST